jgi:MoaA/NifB/PqqE/SkfB family radical SAM enzyme
MRLDPSYLSLFYTTACNSRCTTCHLWTMPQETIDAMLLERLPLFIDPSRLNNIYVTGGEPLLNPIVVDVFRFASRLKRGILFTCDTNGLCPELYIRHVKAILGHGVNCKIGISVNGRKELHDRTRGVVGAYDKVVRTGELLRDIGVLWKINMATVPETEQADIDHIAELAKRLGTTYTICTRERMRVSPRVGFPAAKPVPLFRCAGITKTLCVNPNGDITPCEEGGHPEIILGNLADDGFDETRVRRVRAIVESRGCQPCGNTCDEFYL